MHYHFDISVASKYNVNVAIFLNNIAYWVIQNQGNNINFHNDRYWTYNSVKAFLIIFPFWTEKQIRLIINQCLDNDLLLKNNFNKCRYDRTPWYALSDQAHQLLNIPICPKGQMSNGAPSEPSDSLEPASIAICPKGQIDVSQQSNETCQKDEPIPDNKPALKTHKREEVTTNQFSLSDFDKNEYRFTDTDINLCSMYNLNTMIVFEKFKAYKKSKGIKKFTHDDIHLWVVREIEHLEKRGNSK